MAGKAALIYVVGFGIILGYLSLNMIRSVSVAGDASIMYYEYENSHSLALAGAHMGLAKYFQDSTWATPIAHTLDDGTGSYYVNRVGRTISSISRYRLASGGTISDTVEVYLGQRFNTENSFSMFAWMTNNERGVYWITGDTVYGRLHANSTVNVSGTPIFTGKVTTAASFNYLPGKGTNHGVYQDGWQTKAERIMFPNDLSDLLVHAGAYLYGSEIWVALEAGTPADGDGFATVRTSAGGPVVDTVRINDAAFQGVVMGRNRVHVQGMLDGRLTVSSQTDIYIEDDLVYERDPRYGTTDEMLGLVAEKNVVVSDNPNNWNNCTIQASIFARTGSLLAQNHTSTTSGTGGRRGTLFILGSVVQNNRGAVGRHINGVLQTGYSKSYTYDTRLSSSMVRPPHYPGFYSWTLPITGWWEGYAQYDFGKLDL